MRDYMREEVTVTTWELSVGILALALLCWAIGGFTAFGQDPAPPVAPPCQRVTLPVVVNLDDVKHANLIAHERAAIEAGQPRTVTLERDNAARRRTEDLRGIPTRPGFDRDEWPPAFTEEAGAHSDGRPRDDVAYVASSENRSGGAVMGLALRAYCDGTRFIVEAGRP